MVLPINYLYEKARQAKYDYWAHLRKTNDEISTQVVPSLTMPLYLQSQSQLNQRQKLYVFAESMNIHSICTSNRRGEIPKNDTQSQLLRLELYITEELCKSGSVRSESRKIANTYVHPQNITM